MEIRDRDRTQNSSLSTTFCCCCKGTLLFLASGPWKTEKWAPLMSCWVGFLMNSGPRVAGQPGWIWVTPNGLSSFSFYFLPRSSEMQCGSSLFQSNSQSSHLELELGGLCRWCMSGLEAGFVLVCSGRCGHLMVSAVILK